MQAGARPYPEPPFSKLDQNKPGIEYKLSPEPYYDAPYWKGSGKLQDKAAIITGGDSGIGRAVAILFAREAQMSPSCIWRARKKMPPPRPMLSKAKAANGLDAAEPSDNPEQMESFGCNTRMQRPAQPEEIAPAYLFLASPQMSSFITGEISARHRRLYRSLVRQINPGKMPAFAGAGIQENRFAALGAGFYQRPSISAAAVMSAI